MSTVGLGRCRSHRRGRRFDPYIAHTLRQPLHPALPELVNHARSLGLAVKIFTNLVIVVALRAVPLTTPFSQYRTCVRYWQPVAGPGWRGSS
jgi:hypothetical protein